MARPASPCLPRFGTYRFRRVPVVAGFVWLFVLALLFGAVAPLGPPETLVHGAAFNPATTSVAIGAKRADTLYAADWHRGTDGIRHDSAPGGGGALLPALLALQMALALPVLAPLASLSVPFRPVRCGVRGARAPPRNEC